MTLKHYSIVFILLIQLSISTNAQSLLGINYPLGIPVHGGSGLSQSLGGTGVAIENDILGFSNNPANLGNTKRTVFSTLVFSNLLFIDDTHKKSRHLNMSLSTLSLSIPIGRFGTIGFSAEPSGTSNLQFRNIDDIFYDKDFAELFHEDPLFYGDSIETGIRRSGGAISWQAAWGYNLLKKIRLGVGVKRYNFHESIAEVKQVYGSMSNRFLDSTTTNYSTYAMRGGIIFPFRSISFGLCGEYYFMNQAKSTQLKEGTRDTDVLFTTRRYELKPPPSLTLGCSYQFNQQWLGAIDAGMTLWDRYYSEINSDESFDNAFNISCGIQYIPAPNLLKPKFYEITQYRGGLRYSELPGAMGSEIALTLAAGLPLQTNGGLIDIIVEFLQRQDTRFDNYRENCIGLKLGINGGRKWYQPSNDSY